MRMQIRPLTLALLVACAVAFALSQRVDAQAPRQIRLGTLVPQGTSYHRSLQEMGQRWREGTGGRVTLTVYAGTMGSEQELVRRMRLGQLQAATLTTVGLGLIDPAVTALQQIPMIFRSLDEVDFVLTRLGPTLEQRLADRGFVALFWVDAGWVRFFSRQATARPEEFRRQKMFVTAGETQQVDLMRSSGYNPVPLEWTDALTSLQTGMIDAIPTIPYFALAMQFDTQAKHMLMVNWVPVVGATIISKKVWDALPAEQQTVMRNAALTGGKQFQAQGRKEADDAVVAMQRRGLTVIAITPAIEAEWHTMIDQLYPRIRGKIVPADMFDEVVRLLAEYRSRPGGR